MCANTYSSGLGHLGERISRTLTTILFEKTQQLELFQDLQSYFFLRTPADAFVSTSNFLNIFLHVSVTIGSRFRRMHTLIDATCRRLHTNVRARLSCDFTHVNVTVQTRLPRWVIGNNIDLSGIV